MKLGCVYALLDDTGVRYIGVTTQDAAARLYGHQHDAKTKQNHKSRWLAKLTKNGQRPEIEILEQDVPADILPEREMLWIACLRASGILLTNSTAGGEGICDPTPEVRHKIGSANRGKTFSPERCAAQSRGQTGRKHTEDTKAKIREASLRQVVSDETRQKISVASKGRIRSPESLQRAAEKLRGQKRSAETRAKQSAGQSRFKKPIIDQNGVVYEGAQAAARALGLHQPSIVSVLKGRSKSTGGYTFTYLTIP